MAQEHLGNVEPTVAYVPRTWFKANVRSVEVQALGDLAGEAVSGTAARIEEMHTGVAGRAFGAVGAAGQAFPPVAWATVPVKAKKGRELTRSTAKRPKG